MSPPSATGETRAALDARTLARLARQSGALALAERREGTGEAPAVAARVEEHLVASLPARARALPRLSERSGDGVTRPVGSALVLSPLDGAEAWAAGVPTWTIALALLDPGKPSTSVVYAPAVDDLYVAQAGVLRWNGEVVPEGGFEPARTGLILALADVARRVPLGLRRRRRALGSPAYHLALVARGAADGAILERPHLWDVAPGLALLEASGAEAIDLASRKRVDLEDWFRGRPPKRLVAARRGAMDEVLHRLRRST